MSWRRQGVWLMPLLSGLILWAMWHGAAAWIEWRQMADTAATAEEARSVRRILLPLPSEVVEALLREWQLILGATRNTFLAALIGFSASVIVGFLIALALASSVHIKRALYPWVLALQMTPIVILAPIVAIGMGSGISSVAAVAFLIGFFPVVAGATMGLVSTDRALIDLFRVSGATRFQELTYLRIPYAMPYFLTGMKIAGTLAPIGAITGDIFVGSAARGREGIGYLTIVFRSNLDTAALYATAGVACVLGFIFVMMVNLLHGWILRHWHDSRRVAE